MRMLFPVAYRRPGSIYADGDWAPEGDLLVPNFPCGRQNTFLGLESHLPSELGVVRSIELDPDKLLDGMCAYYTGIARTILEAYIMHTAMGVSRMVDGMMLRVYVDRNSATLMAVDGGQTVTLWDGSLTGVT